MGDWKNGTVIRGLFRNRAARYLPAISRAELVDKLIRRGLQILCNFVEESAGFLVAFILRGARCRTGLGK
jgi:hypothetical protein